MYVKDPELSKAPSKPAPYSLYRQVAWRLPLTIF